MSLANLSVRRRVCVASVIALSVIMSPARARAIGATLYASQFRSPAQFQSPATFYAINTVTGAGTVIGNTNSFIQAMDYRTSNAVLYGASYSLTTINVVTASVTTIAPLPDLMISIAFSPSDQLYAVSYSGTSLYAQNPVTGGTLSSVLLTGTVFASGEVLFPGEIRGIDFGPDGTLYGVGFGLYTINPLTGVATRITPLGMDITGSPSGAMLFNDIDFGADGVLRGVTYDSSHTTKSLLYTINTSTGLGTLVGPTGSDLQGLGSIPTPEPSSLALLAFGTVATLTMSLAKHGRLPREL